MCLILFAIWQECESTLAIGTVLHTCFKMEVLGGERGEDVSLVAQGAEVAVGAVEHREVAAVIVGGVHAVVVEGTHGRALVFRDIGARVYPVQ